jgi:hypothetical protein
MYKGKYKVIATFRDPSNVPNMTALKSIYSDERFVVLPSIWMFTSSKKSHKNLHKVVERRVSSIDILIANDGILIREDNSPLITTVFQTNVIGAIAHANIL